VYRRLQIAIATTYDIPPEHVVEKAKAVARELAKRECVVLTGGNGGLMTIIAKEVNEAGGITVGILAKELEDLPCDHPWHNPYNTIEIRSGASFAIRSFVLVNSCDALIVIAGGSGTLTEVAMAYNYGKPIVVLRGTGMIAETLEKSFPDGYLDHRKTTKIVFADTPEEAVEIACRKAEEWRRRTT